MEILPYSNRTLLDITGDEQTLSRIEFLAKCKQHPMFADFSEENLTALFIQLDYKGDGVVHRETLLRAVAQNRGKFDTDGFLVMFLGMMSFPVCFFVSWFKVRHNWLQLHDDPVLSKDMPKIQRFVPALVVVLRKSFKLNVKKYYNTPTWTGTFLLVAPFVWSCIHLLSLILIPVYLIEFVGRRGILESSYTRRFEENVSIIEALFPFLIYTYFSIQLSLTFVASGDSFVWKIHLEHRLRKLQFATTRKKTSTASPRPKLSSEEKEDMEDFSGIDIDDKVQHQTAKIVGSLDRKFTGTMVLYSSVVPIPLALLPAFMRLFYGQPFYGPNGATGVFIVIISQMTLYLIFGVYFLQLILTEKEFSFVRYTFQIFSGMISESDSIFLQENRLIEVPILDLGISKNLLAWFRMRAYYQTKRQSQVRQMEAIIGVIILAVISFLILILTVVLLGSYSGVSYLSGLQNSLHGRTMLFILAYGSIVLASYSVRVMLTSVTINNLQRDHIATLARHKLQKVAQCSELEQPLSYTDMQMFDSIIQTLKESDTYLSIYGFEIQDAHVKQAVAVTLTSTLTALISFIHGAYN